MGGRAVYYGAHPTDCNLSMPLLGLTDVSSAFGVYRLLDYAQL